MAINDRYQLTLTYTYRGQTMNNVFGYLQVSGTGTQPALALAQLFEVNVYGAIRGILHTSALAQSISVVNVDDFGDYYLMPQSEIIPADGTRPGGESNTFIALGFVLARQTRAVRNGAKRFGGISDDDIVNAGLAAGIVGAVQNVENALGMALGAAPGMAFEPRIMRRIVTGPVENPVYEYQDFPMGAATFRRVTTQNSRKG